jgi:hypothetical protein
MNPPLALVRHPRGGLIYSVPTAGKAYAFNKSVMLPAAALRSAAYILHMALTSVIFFRAAESFAVRMWSRL